MQSLFHGKEMTHKLNHYYQFRAWFAHYLLEKAEKRGIYSQFGNFRCFLVKKK
jgi:hypothetical protein